MRISQCVTTRIRRRGPSLLELRRGVMYMAGFQPFSDKVDTLAEATLIYTFI